MKLYIYTKDEQYPVVEVSDNQDMIEDWKDDGRVYEVPSEAYLDYLAAKEAFHNKEDALLESSGFILDQYGDWIES